MLSGKHRQRSPLIILYPFAIPYTNCNRLYGLIRFEMISLIILRAIQLRLQHRRGRYV